MRNHLEKRTLVLVVLVCQLIVQCTSTTVYKCNKKSMNCGCTRRPRIILKILGGTSAAYNNWDWIVSLRESNVHFCGGSILNEWYIITTAHCFENRTALTSTIKVCADTLRLSDPCHQNRSVASVIFHPLYNDDTFENDIALVRLTTPLDLSDSSLTEICLPRNDSTSKYPADGTEVISIGWGNLKANETPDELLEVKLKVMDKSSYHCNHIQNDYVQLCAGDLGKGISKGDSGTPLMVLRSSKQWELIGVASFMKRNASNLSGSGYTLVAPYIQFIQSYLNSSFVPLTTIKCSCQCPLGFNLGYAYTNIHSLTACVNACKVVHSYRCTKSNTYACFGSKCIYSDYYEHICSCQCPRGSDSGFAYTRNYTASSCINACQAVPSKPCTDSNTYACLNNDCAYSNSYNDSTIAPMPDNQTFLDEAIFIEYDNDGGKYEGQLRDGMKHGQGTQIWANGDKYIGNWFHGRTTGHGIYTWPTGDKYEGGFKDTNMYGQGVYTWADGNKYIGDWLNNNKEGQGIYTWVNGNKYMGDWINDSRTGEGVFTWPNGNKYVGQFKDGSRHGHGIQTWDTGDKYIGDWIYDNRTGQGIYTWLDGTKYGGEFKDGEKHGQGIQTWPDDDRYVGDWIRNSRTGYGVYTFHDGPKYEGQFKDDKKHGHGTQTWPNGETYVGEWNHGNRTGHGVYTWPNAAKYEGQFKDGSTHGRGMQIWANGDKYVGDWVDNIRTGHGIYTWVSGSKYEGSFGNGKREGWGVMKYSNGTIKEGKWRNHLFSDD